MANMLMFLHVKLVTPLMYTVIIINFLFVYAFLIFLFSNNV